MSVAAITREQRRAYARDLQARGLGWAPRAYTPGGWWRDEPLPICEPLPPDHPQRAHARWRRAVDKARAEAAALWVEGRPDDALRVLCGADIFALDFRRQPRKRVSWRSGRPTWIDQPVSPRDSIKCGGVWMRWRHHTIAAALLDSGGFV